MRVSRQRLGAVLALFGLAYFLSLFFRTVNAILAPTLIEELGLNASSLGLLTAAYFLGLGLLQVPIGACLDAFGPGRVQTVLLLIAAAGIGLLAAADGIALLIFARALIGIGLAGCLMAAFHGAALWLPTQRVPFASGLFLATGGLGALAATGPVEIALQLIDWRTLFGVIAAGTLGIAVALYFLAPDHPKQDNASWIVRMRGVAVVVRKRVFQQYLPLTALCFGTGTAMQGLWVSSWLYDVGGYRGEGIAWMLTAMAIALTVGSAAGGAVSMLIERAGFHLRHVVLGSSGVFIGSEIGILFSPVSLAPFFWILFAFTYNAVPLSYALVARSMPVEFVGRSNTCMNTVVILSTFVIQYGLGVFLSGVSGENGGGNAASAYSAGIVVLVGLQIAAFIWCNMLGKALSRRGE